MILLQILRKPELTTEVTTPCWMPTEGDQPGLTSNATLLSPRNPIYIDSRSQRYATESTGMAVVR
jgi:hypothetical protein